GECYSQFSEGGNDWVELVDVQVEEDAQFRQHTFRLKVSPICITPQNVDADLLR
ncbi:tryptophan synthase subunit alpha, partial [Escherichia coli]